ncbi:hypothetical protein OPV22_027557 [Ensete ventricosum]|uniref:Uncharacterized protein n=1 Tax=Ensete ventricosum TaxID=4639 RepID=A0AAV8Q803_ENSVE|nr:hypothetical protein OPV22_027557 [Ensete ventricosum]
MAFSLRHPSSLLVFVALLGFLSLFRQCACSSRNFLNTSGAVLGTSPAEATCCYGPLLIHDRSRRVLRCTIRCLLSGFVHVERCVLRKRGDSSSRKIAPAVHALPAPSTLTSAGPAFWAMAKAGREDTLRAAGAIQGQYSWVGLVDSHAAVVGRHLEAEPGVAAAGAVLFAVNLRRPVGQDPRRLQRHPPPPPPPPDWKPGSTHNSNVNF